MRLELKGKKGDEKIELYNNTTDSLLESATLNKKWRTFSYNTTGRIVLRAKDGTHRIVHLRYGNSFDIEFFGNKWKEWKCGTSSEEIQCKYVREGSLKWKGDYSIRYKSGMKSVLRLILLESLVKSTNVFINLHEKWHSGTSLKRAFIADTSL